MLSDINHLDDLLDDFVNEFMEKIVQLVQSSSKMGNAPGARCCSSVTWFVFDGQLLHAFTELWVSVAKVKGEKRCVFASGRKTCNSSNLK